ncbi:uncharacterized protein [Zea mays]|uniref:uncharacterized protein LOC103633386 n=1 Tax=Zea mays TaxID=4577 RepID=UPI0010704A95|nr:uncharacterized protein LOC103633386 [Zea mays]XP_035816629.1 uncharacterized protein LOC103633386 isoform X1 [Zea mays]XP_035816630.1 uncharacterized protein LOC103633386 isoform X1 [Zea mays]XP_035816631.1 uncharacterized protein LOC103633386 isoform X1 [Zea mays]XP_035816632.1 uncharacterized protein LOC103633386 isoform X1 [Zea mays]XP_035816633.1 uncharacterized protein LOC103633386 isoform X1 [Zea mays]XP_035816634.1 uncharacterized protein LOC103633386 isoform X1 [Zea mays]XP_03581
MVTRTPAGARSGRGGGKEAARLVYRQPAVGRVTLAHKNLRLCSCAHSSSSRYTVAIVLRRCRSVTSAEHSFVPSALSRIISVCCSKFRDFCSDLLSASHMRTFLFLCFVSHPATYLPDETEVYYHGVKLLVGPIRNDGDQC